SWRATPPAGSAGAGRARPDQVGCIARTGPEHHRPVWIGIACAVSGCARPRRRFLVRSTWVRSRSEVQRELDGRERAAVVWGRAEAGERVAVLGRAVAGVALPAVGGVARREASHEAVPGDLGEDRGAGDAVHATIALDDRRL